MRALLGFVLLTAGWVVSAEAKGISREELKAADKAVEAEPSAANFERRAVVRERSGDSKGAFADYAKAIELDPKRTEAYRARGWLRWRVNDDSRGAVEDLTKVIELAPSAKAYHDRAFVCHDFDATIADCTQALALDPHYLEAYRIRIWARQMKGDQDGAIADCTAALAVDPKAALFHYFRGESYHTKLDLAHAVEDYEQAIALNPGDPAYYRARGDVRRVQGDLEGALADYTTSLGKYSTPATLSNRGLVFALQGKWREAAADFDAAHHRDGRYCRFDGAEARLRLGETEAARKELRSRLEQFASEPPAWNLAVCRFLLGEMDEAALLKAAEAGDRETARAQACDAWYYAGVVRLVAGQPEKAADCFRQCVATKRRDYRAYELAVAELARL